MASTLYLVPATWDLAVDINGNIAVAAEPYALAQDAATAIKTFIGECWYNTLLGVQWYSDILGQPLNLALIKSQLITAAETVPDVTSAQVFIIAVTERALSGQVQITDSNGTVTAASF